MVGCPKGTAAHHGMPAALTDAGEPRKNSGASFSTFNRPVVVCFYKTYKQYCLRACNTLNLKGKKASR